MDFAASVWFNIKGSGSHYLFFTFQADTPGDAILIAARHVKDLIPSEKTITKFKVDKYRKGAL